MRYLRMLSNSLVAGTLAAAYVLVLILQLNPTLPLDPVALFHLAITVGLYYAFHLTIAAYAVLVVRQAFGSSLLSPAWISVGVIGWFGAVAAAAGAILMWANLHTFALVVDAATALAVVQGVILLAAASVLFAIVAATRRHGSRTAWACALVAIGIGSVVAPLAVRGRGSLAPLESHSLNTPIEVPPPPHGGRVIVVAVDGASLELITNATSEGRLPNFGRVLDSGAVMHLATLHPTSAEGVWAAVATGKLPQKNGVRSGSIYRLAGHGAGAPIQLLPDYCFAEGLVRFGVVNQEARTSAALRVKPLWAILSTLGITVGTVNWPLTYPAPAVRGFVISDAFARAVAARGEMDEGPAVYPPDIEDEALAAATPDVPRQAIVPAALGGIAEKHQRPARTDRLYERVFDAISAVNPVEVTLLRYQSPDPIGHYFLRYAVPSQFGDVTEDERRRYGAVLEAHYALADEAIGRAIVTLGPDDLLLVVSGFGIEPLGFGKRLLERAIGDPEISGSHEGAPDGFLMAYGASVAKARQLRRASVVDVVPTILYFLGVPVARDMDGYARTDLFQQAFTEERPITFTPTYER